MCVLMIENTPTLFAWVGNETEAPKLRSRRRTTAKMTKQNKPPVKAVTVEVNVRKHSLADQDRKRFYPAMKLTPLLKEHASRQTSTKKMHWAEHSGRERESVNRQEYFKGRNRSHRRRPTVQVGAI